MISPGKEVFPIGRVGVSAVVLAPGELSIEEALVYRRHFRGVIVVADTEIFRAEQPENRACRNGCHEAALLVQPFRVAFFRDAVTDENKTRRA